MNTGEIKMPPHTPTPDDVEHAHFIIGWFVDWWREFLLGTITAASAAYFRSKGKNQESIIVPISEDEIDHKMTICKQSIVIVIHEELDRRDKELFAHIDRKNKSLLGHVKDIIEAGK